MCVRASMHACVSMCVCMREYVCMHEEVREVSWMRTQGGRELNRIRETKPELRWVDGKTRIFLVYIVYIMIKWLVDVLPHAN